jgi:hypothetical protein
MGMNVGSNHLYTTAVKSVDDASETILEKFLLTCRARTPDPNNVRYCNTLFLYVSHDLETSPNHRQRLWRRLQTTSDVSGDVICTYLLA